MQIREIDALYEQENNQERLPMNPNMMSPEYAGEELAGEGGNDDNQYFSQPNDLRVIQEYNREENMPQKIRSGFWGLASKSIKLGFWNKEDEQEIFLHKNIIKLGHIMSKPRHKYTFAERNQINQMDLLVYADYKRGVGMERYKINERTLQATSVTQNIQGATNSPGKKGGMLSGFKSFFG